MVVRNMEIKDAPKVYHISMENFSEPWSLLAIEKEMTNPVASYFVVEVEGEVIGFGGMWHVLDEGEVINIAVQKAYQRQGIGKVILEQLIAEARKRELVVIHLEVRASNEAAKNLYLKQGFNCISTRKSYYHNPTEDAWIMKYELKKEEIV